MRYLYIFPHPDDESFGPAAAMHQQLRQGHEVHLLTLTRGGATRQRHKLGLSVKEMGLIRLAEMRQVEKTLGLSSLMVWDFPDGGLSELDPRVLEREIAAYIRKLRPDVLVSYPVHGISGFHDHLVMHAVIKRLYLEMRDQGETFLRRLAFFTLPDSGEDSMLGNTFRLKQSAPEQIDCILPLLPEDQDMLKRCLACYETYQQTIEATNVVQQIGERLHFELYGESFQPPLTNLADELFP